MKIGELAKQTGVKVVTVRYYEKAGIMPVPSRSASNYRTYGPEHVRRLCFIRRCRELGFSLGQVRDLLQLSSKNARTCEDVCQIAKHHLNVIEAKLADLGRLASKLRIIRESCSGLRPMAECGVIELLSHD